MRTIPLKVIGANDLFPWEMGDVVHASSIKHLDDGFHEIWINETKYTAEFKRWGINDDKVFFNCYLTDGERVGIMGFEISYNHE
jgi:hypothetical protein